MNTQTTQQTAKHTPGPWKVYEVPHLHQGTLYSVRSDEYGAICDPNEAADPYENKANANLIAAAPELLDNLKAILTDYLGRYYENDSTDKDLLTRITAMRSVIAKAEGRA